MPLSDNIDAGLLSEQRQYLSPHFHFQRQQQRQSPRRKYSCQRSPSFSSAALSILIASLLTTSSSIFFNHDVTPPVEIMSTLSTMVSMFPIMSTISSSPIMMMPTKIPLRSAILPILLPIILPMTKTIVVDAVDPNADKYCGSSWMDAFNNCHKPCPNGDGDCTQAGHTCQGYTGCAAKFGGGNSDNGSGSQSSGGGGGSNNNQSSGSNNNSNNDSDSEDPYRNNFCGTKWITAMLTCSKPCPPGTPCTGPGETCFAATNCDKPLEPIVANMIMSLLGADSVMGGNERMVLEESVLNFLAEKLEESKIGLKEAGVTGQEAVSGRRVRERWLRDWYGDDDVVVQSEDFNSGAGADNYGMDDDIGGGVDRAGGYYFSTLYTLEDSSSSQGIQVEFNYTATKNNNNPSNPRQRRRYLPTSSSALDVSMTITGEYRPPPFLDMDMIIEDSINRASARVVDDLRERGRQAGSTYFERVEDMRATSAGKATERPTRTPTSKPSSNPTNQPSIKPTSNPTVEPTDSPTTSPTPAPSFSPTRAFEQSLETGGGAALYEATARSYGNLFEIRTTKDSPTVVIQGFDIYTASTSTVQYEIWTKEGIWQGFQGKLRKFTKIAQGKVKGQGECTAETMEKLNGNCQYTAIPMEEFESVPIVGGGGEAGTRSFYITLTSNEILYSRGTSSDGVTMNVMTSNEDLEIYEGAGVLVYPFNDATDLQFHYRQPRGFLGVVHYHRAPCVGDDNDGWPCETRSPVTSFQLGTGRPTMEPTRKPSRKPSKKPSRNPTRAPTVTEGGDNGDGEGGGLSSSESFINVPSDQEEGGTEQQEEAGSEAEDDPETLPEGEGEQATSVSSTSSKVEEVVDTEMSDNAVDKDEDTTEGSSPSSASSKNDDKNTIAYSPDEPGAPTTVENYSDYSPQDLFETNLVITLDTVPDVIMNDREAKKYQEVILNFLRRKQGELSEAKMEVVSVQVWHQSFPVLERMKEALREQNEASTSRTKYKVKSKGRKLNAVDDGEPRSNDALYLTTMHGKPSRKSRALEEGDESPPASSTSSSSSSSIATSPHSMDTTKLDLEITTIIQSTNSSLPSDVASFLIYHLFDSSETELINAFHAEQGFYSYFREIDGVSGRLIRSDQVTFPPTESPTTIAYSILDEDSKTQGTSTVNLFVATGLGIGVIWCLLTIFSISYLGKARREMMNAKMLNLTSKRGNNASPDDDWVDGSRDAEESIKLLFGEDATFVSHVTDAMYGSHRDDGDSNDMENGLLDFFVTKDGPGDSDSDSDDSDSDDDSSCPDAGSHGTDGFEENGKPGERDKLSLLLDDKMRKKKKNKGLDCNDKMNSFSTPSSFIDAIASGSLSNKNAAASPTDEPKTRLNHKLAQSTVVKPTAAPVFLGAVSSKSARALKSKPHASNDSSSDEASRDTFNDRLKKKLENSAGNSDKKAKKATSAADAFNERVKHKMAQSVVVKPSARPDMVCAIPSKSERVLTKKDKHSKVEAGSTEIFEDRLRRKTVESEHPTAKRKAHTGSRAASFDDSLVSSDVKEYREKKQKETQSKSRENRKKNLSSSKSSHTSSSSASRHENAETDRRSRMERRSSQPSMVSKMKRTDSSRRSSYDDALGGLLASCTTDKKSTKPSRQRRQNSSEASSGQCTNEHSDVRQSGKKRDNGHGKREYLISELI